VLVAGALLALGGLTGCSTYETGDGQIVHATDGCSNLLTPGALSDGVQVTGSGIDVLGPTDVLNAQRSVIEQGDSSGYRTQQGDVVNADVTVYDATTGTVLDERAHAPHLALPESAATQLREILHSSKSDTLTLDFLIATSLVCTVPGDQLVVALTPAQSMASQLPGTAIAVIDVRETFPQAAQGSSRALPNGFPAVATDHTGRPGVVLPPQGAPKSLQVAPRIVGHGPEVGAESAVIGHVLSVSWDGQVVSSTWDQGLVSLGSEESPNPNYSFRKSLTGLTAGSQVVILDPSDGNPMVHVVDVIAVA